REGEIRVEPDCLVEVPDGAVVLALVSIGGAPAVEGDRVIRVELDRLIVVPDGVVVLALVAVRVTAVDKSEGIIRVELDRLIEVLDGTVILVLVSVGIAAVGQGESELLWGLLARLDDRRAGIYDELEVRPRPDLAMLVVECTPLPLSVPILCRCHARQHEEDNRQNGQPTGPHVLLQMTFRCRRI